MSGANEKITSSSPDGNLAAAEVENNVLRDWALYYADKGLAVLPLMPRGKYPIGSLVHNGVKQATTDRKQIETWWRQCPDANIGIATGQVSKGLFAVDLDVDEEKGIDGRDSLRDWEKEHGAFPGDTWISITGRGGNHYFYWDNSNVGNRTNVLEGIDIRGDGGLVVAPPSIHENGRRYEWEQSPEEYNALPASETVLKLVTYQEQPEDGQKVFRVPEKLVSGARNTVLFQAACSLQAKGFSDRGIRALIQIENEERCETPLPDQELEKIVKSALRYPKGGVQKGGTRWAKRRLQELKKQKAELERKIMSGSQN